MLQRPALASLLVIAVLVPFALADDEKKPEDEDPNDLSALEKLAVKVELEGHVDGKRLRDDLSLVETGELPRPQNLRYPSVRSSLEAEGAFVKRYYEEYVRVFDETGARARKVSKDLGVFSDPVKGDDGLLFAKAFLNKYPVAKRAKKGDKEKLRKDLAINEVRTLCSRLLERWERLRERAKTLQGDALEKALEARQEKSRAFLKQYELGEKIAKTRLDGSANLHIDLGKDTYELVKREIGILQSRPLADAKGNELKWKGKTLHGAPKLFLIPPRILELLAEHEYVVVQYALREGDEEKGLIRLTIAQLLLGTYLFIEAHDRFVVIPPSPPEGK